MTTWKRIVKRGFDLVGAGVGVVCCLPVIIGIAVTLRLTMGRPIFFKQSRPGFHGRPFSLYKFRTMRNDTDAQGKLLSDAERLTKFGRFLLRREP